MAVVIALPFVLTACSSSGGSGGAFGQKTVQLNSSSAGSGATLASGRYVAPSAFCAAVVKSSEDSEKMDSGDPGTVTVQTELQDMQAILALAPDSVKGDVQTLVDAGKAAIASGATAPDSTESADPKTQAAADRLSDYAVANCHSK